ncbi:U32 family peptidase [Fodinisporobacter ferrooxydans]|uniref:U32 family peptidase n=1 Tax=Fodinisporobacter ferrooxydans TaxID=2901836 RepID=A0ABY4CMY3_9BACL|nr:U32 family peptidase [Alicyclobacillaceae bacterium MYW30-H2]
MSKKRTELLVSAGSVQDVEKFLLAGADAVAIGNERYGLRLPGSFDLANIREAATLAHARNKSVYVVINALLHQEELSDLKGYIMDLANLDVDAVVFGDPAVLFTVREHAPQMKLHWNTETTSTNFHTVNFWAAKGAVRAVLARELSLQNVLAIKQHSRIEIQAQIHGMTCIFHSKRELVSNFMKHKGQALEAKENLSDSSMYLKEDKREEQQYPVFEDYHGTHIMSHEDICMLEHMGPLIAAGIDAVKIETILKPVQYNEAVIAIYRKAMDQYLENPSAPFDAGLLAAIRSMQPQQRPLGTGFYFKEQIY